MTEEVETKKHAILSPSGADRWMVCRGSVALTKDLPNPDNEYSIEGTDYHELASICLEDETNALEYVGQALPSGALVSTENAVALQKYIDLIRSLHGAIGGDLLVEQRVPISAFTGEKDAEGTSDAVIIGEGDELIVGDLKFGMGVQVFAEKNRQLMIYALGVLQKHELWDVVKTVCLVICQPRLDHVSEWACSIEYLREFAEEVKRTAKPIMDRLLNPTQYTPLPLVPDEKACRFCLYKATLVDNEYQMCPALKEHAEKTLLDGFETIDGEHIHKVDEKGKPIINVTGEKLAALMRKANVLETFANAIYDMLTAARATVERELQNGNEVPGYKLVEGKKGNREWTDEEAVETIMKKQFRLLSDDMYSKKLISPAKAEAYFKKTEQPGRWNKLKKFIEQKPGKDSVAPADDPRPALRKGHADEDMEVVSDDEDNLW